MNYSIYSQVRSQSIINGAVGENGLAALRNVVVRAYRKERDRVLLPNSAERSVLQKHKQKLESVVLKSPVQVCKDILKHDVN